MAVPMDVLHRKFLDKLQYLSEVCAYFPNDSGANCANSEISDLTQSYMMAVAHHVISGAASNYNRELARADFVDKAETIEQNLLQIANIVKETNPENDNALSALRILAQSSKLTIDRIYTKCEYDVCKCGGHMCPTSMPGEITCNTCGKVKYIVGSLSRDIVSDRQHIVHNSRSCMQKQGNYDTARHYKFWSDRLQAIETKEFDPAVLKKIHDVIIADGINCKTLSCKRMRKILKDSRVNETDLNKHVPLLVKKFGGVPPPRLTHEENKLTSLKFNRIIVLYDIVNPYGNKPYYPYFLYKIWDDMFEKDRSKRRILQYIHIQSPRTVIKNDKIYKLICEASTEEDKLEYKPTNYN